MKKLITVLALALLFNQAVLCAQDNSESHKQEDTELGKTMSKMNGAWRKIRRQASDSSQNASSLELLATIQAAAKKSLNYTPDLAKDIPADKRAAFIEGYQAKIKELIDTLVQLESLFKAGDNTAAVELLNKISSLQKQGHREYKRPD